jgi:hypothetical protein
MHCRCVAIAHPAGNLACPLQASLDRIFELLFDPAGCPQQFFDA